MTKTIAILFGVIYLIVGIVGFIPSIGGTTGMAPPTNLLGLFPINFLHNVVHLIIGLAGLLLGRTEAGAASFGRIFGIILIIVGICGFFWPANLEMSVLPLRGSDIWLHLVSGIILAIAGFAGSRAAATA